MLPPRRLRIRFSLRMLLLMTTLVAIGLAIYRRPWTESESAGRGNFNAASGFYGRTVSYRYDLQGNRVKHGVETWYNARGGVFYEGYYVNGEYTGYRQFNVAGQLIEELKNRQEANEQGTRCKPYPSGQVMVQWQRLDQSQTSYEWQTRDGTTLQSLVIDRRSGLTRWNGLAPLAEAERLLAELPDPSMQKAWLMPSAEWVWDKRKIMPLTHTNSEVTELRGFGGNIFRRNLGGDNGQLFLQTREMSLGCDSQFELNYELLLSTSVKDDQQPFLLDLVQRLAEDDYTLQLRFGLLAVVPINRENLRDFDSFGITDVQFPTGSAEEKAWLEPIQQINSDNFQRHDYLKQLFAGTPIRIESPAAGELEPRPLPVREFTTPELPCLRSRRDQLGSFLLQRRMRVVQKDGVLQLSFQ